MVERCHLYVQYHNINLSQVKPIDDPVKYRDVNFSKGKPVDGARTVCVVTSTSEKLSRNV